MQTPCVPLNLSKEPANCYNVLFVTTILTMIDIQLLRKDIDAVAARLKTFSKAAVMVAVGHLVIRWMLNAVSISTRSLRLLYWKPSKDIKKVQP